MTTTPEPRSVGRGYALFAGQALAMAVLAAAVGYVPTQRLAGDEGILAMLAGCGISLLASILGAVPVAMARRSGGAAALNLVTASMALRFLLVLIFGLAVALSGLFDKTPLLIWMGLSYAALLAVDTRYALATIRDREVPKP